MTTIEDDITKIKSRESLFLEMRSKILSWLERNDEYSNVLEYWKSDDGCKFIQQHLCGVKIPESNLEKVKESVSKLDSIFSKLKKERMTLDFSFSVYRGSRMKETKGYIPTAFEREECEAYTHGYGEIKEIKVKKGVPWIPFTTEKEILLQRAK